MIQRGVVCFRGGNRLFVKDGAYFARSRLDEGSLFSNACPHRCDFHALSVKR